MAMMIRRVARVDSSHPYLEKGPSLSPDSHICVFHLGFGLVEGCGQPGASMYEAFCNPMPRCACDAGS